MLQGKGARLGETRDQPPHGSDIQLPGVCYMQAFFGRVCDDLDVFANPVYLCSCFLEKGWWVMCMSQFRKAAHGINRSMQYCV